MANADRFHPGNALIDETVVDVLLNQPSRGVAADLAGMKRDCINEILSRRLNVDVIWYWFLVFLLFPIVSNVS